MTTGVPEKVRCAGLCGSVPGEYRRSLCLFWLSSHISRFSTQFNATIAPGRYNRHRKQKTHREKGEIKEKSFEQSEQNKLKGTSKN